MSQSVKRAADILDVIAARPSTVAQLAEAFGIHRSTMFRELQTLVADVLSRRKFGSVTLDELPEAIRSPRTTGLIERAEEEAIRRALLEAGGNRLRAAEILGVSRATVYRKMKSYKLSS